MQPDPHLSLVRWVFQRTLALVYLIAFIGSLHQFRPLLGEQGLLPVSLFVQRVPFSATPSLFHFFPKDSAFLIVAWIGILLACVALTGLSDRYKTWFSMTVWGLLYVLYLSFVNVGQTFYAFGWESILLEAGIYAIFLGPRTVAPSRLTIWMVRWLLFRVMFGAGMIKIRGDECWRDFTCLQYHYETQPMPNPLSWYFHHGPLWLGKAGVGFNHFAELIAPFGYLVPGWIGTIAGLTAIAFQGTIMASGNLSWLNFLTMVLAISALDGRFLRRLVPLSMPETTPSKGLRITTMILAGVVGLFSIAPIRNLFSSQQMMNFSYNPFHLVGSYGAFGSITQVRHEIVIEGTDAARLTPETLWREYEFKGKPGDPARMPPQIAPYHLRIDWLMWFAAMSSYQAHPWFVNLVAKLLQGDAAVIGLLKTNPFPGRPPRFIRAVVYEYHFTTPEDRKQTGQWWKRTFKGLYLPILSMDAPGFRDLLKQQGWLD